METEAHAEFLTGARLKAQGQRLIAQGQEAMERGAWMLVDEGKAKADVPDVLASWLAQDDGVGGPLDDVALGVSEHSVLRWLAPRNRARVLKEQQS